jgi:hypothetical protein
MLIENVDFLRNNFPELRNKLLRYQEMISAKELEIVQSKIGVPTLKINRNGMEQYVHSKYDPLREAIEIVNKYDSEVSSYDHVLFYGAGFGYHIEEFLRRYPNLNFSIYEPDPKIFYLWMCSREIINLSSYHLKNIFVEFDASSKEDFFNYFLGDLKEKVLLVCLPSYERLFNEYYECFVKELQERTKKFRSNFHTNVAYQRRWVINSLLNFTHVIVTPNILHDYPYALFENKPAIIAAAGPSLEEEKENLRYIKENKLAYIFAVGSAINALIEYGVKPDAVVSYDPSERNQAVFAKMIEKKIDDIPLIFGSSIGYETLQKYPGPKIHMITSQDTFASYCLRLENLEQPKVVFDAPSIAVLTIQLLGELGFEPIILVGQNLAYKDNKYYSSGIEYGFRPSEMTNKERENVNKLLVRDVYGNMIPSNTSWIMAREQIELYLKTFMKEKEVINSTKGGAHIEGTVFQTLEELITERLNKRVVQDILEQVTDNQYDVQYLQNKVNELMIERLECKEFINKCLKIINKLKNTSELKDDQLNDLFYRFDRTWKRLQKNHFYKVFIQPMNRMYLEVVKRHIDEIKYERYLPTKAQKVYRFFGNYLYYCFESYQLIEDLFIKVKDEIGEVVPNFNKLSRN